MRIPSNEELAKQYTSVVQPTIGLESGGALNRCVRGYASQEQAISNLPVDILQYFATSKNLEKLPIPPQTLKIETLAILEKILLFGVDYAKESFYQERSMQRNHKKASKRLI